MAFQAASDAMKKFQLKTCVETWDLLKKTNHGVKQLYILGTIPLAPGCWLARHQQDDEPFLGSGIPS